MIIGIKDAAKLVGISIVSCCAVFVCTLFLNYNIDLAGIEGQIVSAEAAALYNAIDATCKVVIAVTGGCLTATSAVLLFFYIKHYIDSHKKELGILKALGHSEMRIAKNFWIFGVAVFFGAAVGAVLSYAYMPAFYETQNADKLLPAFSAEFHPMLLLYFVALPSLFFSLLSVAYAYRKLKKPVMDLLKERPDSVSKSKIAESDGKKERPFLKELKHKTVRSKQTLAFLVAFAVFCYASMIQMSFRMEDYASTSMGAMIALIGIVLAFTTLFLSLSSVVAANRKTLAMMRVTGYRQTECANAVLGGYRPFAYLGFALGTVYQYALLKIMIGVVFKNIDNVAEYNFDFAAFFVTLASFVIVYEAVMLYYTRRIRKISVKEIMLD